ncbi:vomeronasal type-1 receptor 1 [Rattus norvegicus]|uniref:vomeronasal type-1 receptor 1 n=1 Tax=Rattus norvegicus TaxID=10116 RepID=UPI000049F1FD|nr:vomeronasal type-1 receptor 1 [Rattus norvegicus]|eukprot:NP_001008963.1 vomeronasal 1 receptor 54 [Rattus norvegicus]
MDTVVYTDLNWGIMFLIQTTAGILGNSFLFHMYNFPFFTTQMVRPTNLIINQLIISNHLVLLSKWIPQTVTTLGLTSFLEDAGCKLFVLCLYRVARGVSLSTTSLLRGFQAIKLHPNTSEWLSLRIRSSKWIGTCCFLCWMLQLMLNIHVTIIANAPQNTKNLTSKGIQRYCYSTTPQRFVFVLLAMIIALSDTICLVIRALASGSMVLVLRKHKQQVQYIHRHSLSPKPAHEKRATRTIQILVTMFLSFYPVAAILSLCITETVNPSHWLITMSVLISLAFPTLSPFVLNFTKTCFPPFCSFGQKK